VELYKVKEIPDTCCYQVYDLLSTIKMKIELEWKFKKAIIMILFC